MYRYIVNREDKSGSHFSKHGYLDEVKSIVGVDDRKEETTETMNAGSNLSSILDGSGRMSTSAHVYRIKDIMDAINTSVVMDGVKKENYIQLLSDDREEFDGGMEFKEICEEVGECDIF